MPYIKNLSSKNLFEILPIGCFDLIGSFSMSPFGLATLRNELLLNRRSNVLEFGCGLSTIYMALIIQKFQLNSRIISIESDQSWYERLLKKIDDYNLNDIVKMVHSPLIPEIEMGGENKWYQIDKILNSVVEKEKFDMILIDGPAAFSPEIALSRYMAVPFVIDYLAENFAIILDDADREGEQILLKIWDEQFKIAFKTYGRIAICRKGPFINSLPSFLNMRTGH